MFSKGLLDLVRIENHNIGDKIIYFIRVSMGMVCSVICRMAFIL